jgi:hypothetical protein
VSSEAEATPALRDTYSIMPELDRFDELVDRLYLAACRLAERSPMCVGTSGLIPSSVYPAQGHHDHWNEIRDAIHPVLGAVNQPGYLSVASTRADYVRVCFFLKRLADTHEGDTGISGLARMTPYVEHAIRLWCVASARQ